MKSIEVRFNEAMAALKKADRMKRFDDASKACKTIEAKLRAAEAVLAESGVVRSDATGNQEFRESFSEGYRAGHFDPRKLQIKSYMAMGLSEADARKVLGLPPAEIEALGRTVVNDYVFARASGVSESLAIEIAKKGRTQHR